MQQQTLLVTGGAGFIGSHFIACFLSKYPSWRVLNLDKLTYAADLSRLQECENNPRYRFVQGDICDAPLLAGLFEKYDVRGVIHFAAESHVDNSISCPGPFIKTNVEGTFALLEAARSWWQPEGRPRAGYENCRFHHISTDEVYGSLGPSGLFSESSPCAPNSPYAASKASSDFLVRAYYRTYGLNVTTSRCSNNYGPKQHAEKLIPTIIRRALAGQPVPIYGDGQNIRDWLYVQDHCAAVCLVWEKGRRGETYNIGGRHELTNVQMAQEVCALLDELAPAPDGKSYRRLITFVQDRPGHDFRYAVDASKIAKELGWRVREDFGTGLRQTVRWYLSRRGLSVL